MSRVAGLEAEPTEGDEASGPEQSPVELVIELVNREPRKIRSRNVGAILRQEGHRISNTAVSNALYYAASDRGGNKIQQIARGWYAPLSYSDVNGAASALNNDP